MENEYLKLNELTTPCFIFHEEEFIKNVINFQSTLEKYFANSIIGYSFKTNSLPRLLYLARINGCFAEVVSDDEYSLARRVGFEPDRIIFNGPVKGKDLFTKAINNNSLVNIDSSREIEWLMENKLEHATKIGIRVNFDLESKLPGHSSTGNQGGRFGFCLENGELHNAIAKIKKCKSIKIDRLHMHISNASKSKEVYELLANVACDIIGSEELAPSYIDFGGGYFGGGDNGAAYEQYVASIYNVLRSRGFDKIGVIVEPGASVVATAFQYLSRVVDVKETTYGTFVVTDGTRLHIDPFMIRQKYCYVCIPKRTGSCIKQTICGYTCMEKDRLMQIADCRLETGDLITYRVVGSYSISFNSCFISFLPMVYSKINENYVVIRDKWEVEESINRNRWML